MGIVQEEGGANNEELFVVPSTRKFRGTVMEPTQDRVFRVELLREPVESYLFEANVSTVNLLFRDYINATVFFEEVAQDLKVKSGLLAPDVE